MLDDMAGEIAIRLSNYRTIPIKPYREAYDY